MFRDFDASNAAVPNSGLTLVGPPVVFGTVFRDLVLVISNASAAAELDNFSIEIKVTEASQWRALLTGAEFGVAFSNTNGQVITWRIGTPNTLGKSTFSILRMAIGPVHAIQFKAKSKVDTGNPLADITIRGRLSR